MFESLIVDQKKCYSDCDHEDRFRNTGFVDVQVVKKVVDIGNWRTGGKHHLKMKLS